MLIRVHDRPGKECSYLIAKTVLSLQNYTVMSVPGSVQTVNLFSWAKLCWQNSPSTLSVIYLPIVYILLFHNKSIFIYLLKWGFGKLPKVVKLIWYLRIKSQKIFYNSKIWVLFSNSIYLYGQFPLLLGLHSHSKNCNRFLISEHSLWTLWCVALFTLFWFLCPGLFFMIARQGKKIYFVL